MRIQLTLVVLALLTSLGGFVGAAPSSTDVALPAFYPGFQPGGWIVNPTDCICGIDDPRKISHPAQVDYETLLEATPEIREMRRERIDPNSPRGRQLRKAASELITKAAELVRRAQGHCGVWKVIRHEDGRVVPDLTEEVKARF